MGTVIADVAVLPVERAMNVILHLGLGAFHRAHQAAYLQRLHDQADHTWTLAGGNIRADANHNLEALIAQRGEYTLETIAANGERRYQRIRSIGEVVPYDVKLARLIEIGALPSTKIISFTVTEAGYGLDAAHRLDVKHDDIRSDLDHRTCRTIYGAVTAMLTLRMQRDAGPVTCLSCDNVRGNGTRFLGGLSDFVDQRKDRALRDWIATHVTCPNAMVDRITPRPTSELGERVQAAMGWHDRAPVMSEDFLQWVIEDNFINGRPDWENVGAELVSSVHPYEEAKIRLLNATHSCIAWAGCLIGLTHIHEGIAVPAIRQMAYDYITNDAIPALLASPIDLAAYRDRVLERFSNAGLRDANERVAMDGFAKIPGFIVPTIADRLASGDGIADSAMLPALFFNFLRRWHRHELPFRYQDGAMDAAAVHGYFASADPLAMFAADASLWGSLAGNATLLAALRIANDRVGQFVVQNYRAG